MESYLPPSRSFLDVLLLLCILHYPSLLLLYKLWWCCSVSCLDGNMGEPCHWLAQAGRELRWVQVGSIHGKCGLMEIFQHVLVHTWRMSFVLGTAEKCYIRDRSSLFTPKQSQPGRLCCVFMENTSAWAWCLQLLSIVFLFNIYMPYISFE